MAFFSERAGLTPGQIRSLTAPIRRLLRNPKQIRFGKLPILIPKRNTGPMARTTPRPGRAVRGSTTGRPVMAALDLLGRRWALQVLWELRDGPRGFRELQDLCGGMSSSVLRDRLAELVEAGLVAKNADDQNELTALGRELGTAIEPLAAWARRWARGG